MQVKERSFFGEHGICAREQGALTIKHGRSCSFMNQFAQASVVFTLHRGVRSYAAFAILGRDRRSAFGPFVARHLGYV